MSPTPPPPSQHPIPPMRPQSNATSESFNNYPPLPIRKDVSDEETDLSSDIEEGQLVTAADKRREEELKQRARISSSASRLRSQGKMSQSAPATSRQFLSSQNLSPSSSIPSPRSATPIKIPPQHRRPSSQSSQDDMTRRSSIASTSNTGQVSTSIPSSAPSSIPKARWTSGEKEEAMQLIKEITSLGCDPIQLVEAGIRADIVAVCCRELNLPFSLGQDALLHRSDPVDEQDRREPRAGRSSLPAKPTLAELQPTSPRKGNRGGRPKQLSRNEKKARRRLQLQQQQEAADLKRKRHSLQHPQDLVSGADNDQVEGMRASSSSFALSSIPLGTKRGEELPVFQETSSSYSSATPSWGLSQSAPESERIQLRSAPVLPVMKPIQESGGSFNIPPSALTASASLSNASSMEEMRKAALASMKRKNVAADRNDKVLNSNDSTLSNVEFQRPNSIVSTFTAADDESRPIIADKSLLNVPRGPRLATAATKANYHDIDAPQEQNEDGEGKNFDVEGSSSFDSPSLSTSDPRQAKRPKISYAVDYSWDVDAPMGEVDLEAPLPSLNLPAAVMKDRIPVEKQKRVKRRPVAADLLDASGTTYSVSLPPQPFLRSAQWQRLVLDCSDDESEENSENFALHTVRQQSTDFIAQIWRKLNKSNDEEAKASSPRPLEGRKSPMEESRGGSPHSMYTSDTSDTLRKREQEIREMNAMIHELERKRGQAPSDPRILANTAKNAVEGLPQENVSAVDDTVLNQAKEAVADNTAVAPTEQPTEEQQLSVPTYESPFNRYPGLREMLEKGR